MKRLVCEMCGGSDLVKQDGVFICQNCGTKYSVEEAKKMMVEGAVTVEGTVAVEGTVKVDKSEELKNLYILARRAKEADNSENACKYYNEIVLKDPDNWEANFYLVYYKAASCKKGQIGNEAYNVTNCLKSTIKLLVENLGTGDEAKGFIDGIRKDLAEIAGPMIHGAMDVHEYSYIGQILRMQEMLGNSLKEYPELHSQAVDAWKQLIATYIKYACFGEVKIDYVDMYGYTPEDAVRAIYELDPSYEDPFGITKKLRRNEKFITCPKCGATMRERESKCPQCGTPKEEIQRLIAEKEAAEAAERERIRKEREAKEAEEARIRGEERAKWWAANKKKVIVTILTIIALFIGVIVYHKMAENKRYQQALAEAKAYIASGDSCVAIYHFDKAQEFYDKAKRSEVEQEVRNEIAKKESALRNAQAQSKQKAEKEKKEQVQETAQYIEEQVESKPKETSTSDAKYIVPTGTKKIKAGQFLDRTDLRKVIIPNSVTSIEEGAFYGCSNLTSVEIPNSVTSIGDRAFYYCSSLSAVTIPNSVTSIGESAFSDCISSLSIVVPRNVTRIGEYAFCNVPNIVYSGDATGSPWGARGVNGYIEGVFVFTDASKSELLACTPNATGKISIPNSVIRIGKNAFWRCKNMTSVEIPNSVTSIGDHAFRECRSLTSITIPYGVTIIGWETFYSCRNLKSVTIPNSVTSIDHSAFNNCESLTSIEIPSSVTKIGNHVFSGCKNLDVIIPEKWRDKVNLEGCKSVTYY